jgi:hypothetical protein
VNKLQSFLAENDTRVQPVEPGQQTTITGGNQAPVKGDGTIIIKLPGGDGPIIMLPGPCIPKKPIF